MAISQETRSERDSSGSARSGSVWKLLTRNTVLNLLGRILPMGIAVVCIPFVVDRLGTEPFGVLTLAWMVVGYFGIFDLGVGRATTQFVARAVENNQREDLPTVVWTSLEMLVGQGIIGAIAVAMAVPWLVNDVFTIPAGLIGEAEKSFMALALSMPFIIGASGGRGVLEGHNRFGLVNAIRIPASAFNFVSPVIVLLLSGSLFQVVLVLAIGRAAVFVAFVGAAIMSLKTDRRPRLPRGTLAKELLGYGGWVTVTNMVGALMSFGYIDRFVVSSRLDMSAVAYYSTPFEMVSKLLFLPAALVMALFPLFAACGMERLNDLRDLLRRSQKAIVGLVAPVVILVVAFAGPGIDLWLGEEFRDQSTFLLQLMAVGILFIALGTIPSGAIQAVGRPDLTAMRHLVELPLYAAASWWAAGVYGLTGVATVWMGYAAVDVAVLWIIAARLIDYDRSLINRDNAMILCSVLTITGLAFGLTAISSLVWRSIAAMISLALVVLGFWRGIMTSGDRAGLIRLIGSLNRRRDRSEVEL